MLRCLGVGLGETVGSGPHLSLPAGRRDGRSLGSLGSPLGLPWRRFREGHRDPKARDGLVPLESADFILISYMV